MTASASPSLPEPSSTVGSTMSTTVKASPARSNSRASRTSTSATLSTSSPTSLGIDASELPDPRCLGPGCEASPMRMQPVTGQSCSVCNGLHRGVLSTHLRFASPASINAAMQPETVCTSVGCVTVCPPLNAVISARKLVLTRHPCE